MSVFRLSGAVLILMLAGAPARGQDLERKTFFDFSDDLVEGSIDGSFVVPQRMGSARMRRANQMAARILEQRMQRHQQSDLQLIRQAGAADVVVLSGSFDRVESVLRAVKIKHVVIPPRLVARVPLMSLQTLMVNCPGHLEKKARQVLRRFVKTGGYLVTTDWALREVESMFPGTIARGGRNTNNDVVSVQLHEKDHPLLRHVRPAAGEPSWWLEASSFPIRVLDPTRVKVLISSQEMKKKYGHPAIAVTFRHDDGQVLHMTSHFYLQQARLRGQKERAKASAFARGAGLDGEALAALRKEGLDEVEAGAVGSAYAMQQVTTNVLVEKARTNKQLLSRFLHRAAKGFSLRSKPASDAPAVEGVPIQKGYLLRVLGRRSGWARVRDLFGREGWAAAAAVEDRPAREAISR